MINRFTTPGGWLAASMLLAISVAVDPALPQDARVARMPQQHVTLFQQHCYECHDASTEEAGVNLETLSFDISRDMETAGMWQKVLNALNSGEMPPPDSEPIPGPAKLAFLEHLTEQMVQARKILGDSQGKIPLRRLNRREYANTIESLVGVRPDVSLLPTDQTGSGFDTQGASLFMSSDQVEQYLASARTALKVCFEATPSSREFKHRVEVEEQFNPRYRAYFDDWAAQNKVGQAYLSQTTKKPADFGLIDEYEATRVTNIFQTHSPILKWYFARPENQTGGALIMVPKNMGMARIKLPSTSAILPGRYRVRVRVASYAESLPRYRYLEFSNLVGTKQRDFLGCRYVDASLDDPAIIEFDFDQPPGMSHSIQLHQRTHQDRGDKTLWTAARKLNGFGLHPGLWVDWAEIELIEPSAELIEMRSQILGHPEGKSETEYVLDVLNRFGERAFRGRSPSQAYLDSIVAIYRDLREEGMSVESALIEPLAIMLASPEFLYMVNEGQPGSELLTQIELANRLSFMLWSEPADQTLLELASAEKLSSPDVLRQQTKRLLADSRSRRFIRDFTHQWLQLDRLGMFQFNGFQFPTFDNSVREYGREEIFKTVEWVLREQLPLERLLKSDFVVVNDLLAEYYGVPGVKGHQFRKVAVGEDSIRGGLMGTVAVCAMGSDGLRTSPVERGAWVMRHLLHDPPAPAPPNVPQLSRLDGEVVSARDIQKLHQEQPQCAQCHRKIDPIGFGLENFSAAGLWREKEDVKFGKRDAHVKTFEIDPSGQLPSGETFDGYQQLRTLVASKHDQFARGLVEELIAYGLGRPYGFADETLADSIIQETHGSGFAIEDILHALIQSRTFQSQ